MSGPTTLPGTEALIETLELALSQCREQVRVLAEKDQRIEHLSKENERLRQESASRKDKSNENVEARYAAGFQDLFKQCVDKQAEIDRLKDKVRNFRIRLQRRSLAEPITSSPAPSSADNEPRPSPLVQPESPRGNEEVDQAAKKQQIAIPDLDHSSIRRKRLRSSSPPRRQPLQEISTNIDPVTTVSRQEEDSRARKRKHRLVESSIAALPELAEDGDNNLDARRTSRLEQKSKPLRASIYNRLDSLLEGQQVSNPLFQKPHDLNPHSIKRETESSTPVRPVTVDSSSLMSSKTDRARLPRFSIAGTKKRTSHSPEDDEPFRSRPVNRLNLTHFKLNPDTNGGLDYAYDQTVRGSERKCLPGCTKECCIRAWKALASTLPTLPTLNGQKLSDDDLILWYMGPGSEERIKNLTTIARSNLVQEARIKFIADIYGKMHRDPHERGRSPPGFWRTDMPGSQEERNDRQSAKLREREEIARRHNEAMKEGGRWKFADE